MALVLFAVLGTPCAHAGRTDIEWMAPTRPELLMDAAGGLERLGVGRPAQVPAGGPAAAHVASVSAMVSEMRIATHEEAQALLQGSALPGGADSGADTATLSVTLSISLLPVTLSGVLCSSCAASIDCASA